MSGCNEDVEQVTPQQQSGRVVFWSDFQGAPINVYMDGSFKGTITAISQTTPECGSSGNVTVTLSPGTYSYYAEDGTYEWSGRTFTVKSGQCASELLTN